MGPRLAGSYLSGEWQKMAENGIDWTVLFFRFLL